MIDKPDRVALSPRDEGSPGDEGPDRSPEPGLPGSEQQFQLLLQGVTDYAIYMLDADGIVSNWNAGAQKIKGYLPQEIIGQHFSRFYTAEDQAAGVPDEGLRIAIAEGRFESEGWRVRKDGTRFWAHAVIDPIRDDSGKVIGFAKITRDVTERREAQRALEEAREALFQSRKMDAIGQLTGGVAHDFNNLLMVIIASLELLRKRMPPDPALSPLIDNAMQGAERGAALTQRMLAFARRQQLKLEPVDVAELARGMMDLLRRALGPTLTVEMQIPARLPPAMTDANQFEAALLNLAVNARDATDGKGVVTISARIETVVPGSSSDLAPGDYVCVAVSDTGEGMDPDTLAHAIEPFFTTKGIGKGTGLGVPMVHGLAAQSGGRLTLKSRKGEGTTAELWIPAAPVDAAPARPPVTVEEAVKTPRLAVLAVDDDGLVLMNTVAMLEDLGHEAIPATSADDALAIARTGRPLDLVVTDQAMPTMTGLQLADILQTERPGLPVLLATGYAELPPDADVPRLSKPFLQRDLARAIARAVAHPLVD